MDRYCKGCKSTKPLDNFKDARQQCNSCLNDDARRRKYHNTDKFIVQLIANAKHHSQIRSTKGRLNAGVFEFSVSLFQEVWIRQNGKCYYSKIPLVLRSRSDWQCTLERLDPSQGYSKENVVLIALEFQSPSQWSSQKYAELKGLLECDQAAETIDWNNPARLPKSNPESKVIDDIMCHKCRFCNNFKVSSDFLLQYISLGCANCRSANKKAKRCTPRGHMQNLLDHMRSNSKKRGHEPPTLTLIDLIRMFEEQRGLCEYSGVPLKFGSYLKTDWTCSVERKNPSKNYTLDNICLICFEFNTSDYSSWSQLDDLDHYGGAAWSKDKMSIIRESLSND